jgi:hypothetical protein
MQLNESIPIEIEESGNAKAADTCEGPGGPSRVREQMNVSESARRVPRI